MEWNVGKNDRVTRFVIGFVLFLLGMYVKLAIISAIGLLIFLTGVVRFCLIYKIFKINTICDREEECVSPCDKKE